MLLKSSLLFFSFLMQFCAHSWAGSIAPHFATSKSCYGEPKINMGTLIYNPYFKIYRSSGMGKDGLQILKNHLSKNHLDFPKLIIYMNQHGLEDSLMEFLRGKFLDLRSDLTGKHAYYSTDFAQQEEELSIASTSDLEHFTFLYGGNEDVYLNGHNPSLPDLDLPEVHFSSPKSEPVLRHGGVSAIYTILKELLTSESPVLFHCEGGLHRTGMTGLMLRYLQGGVWTDEDLTKYGTVAHHHQLRNLAEYEYHQHNPERVRPENLETIYNLATHDPKFKCLKEKFGPYLNAPSETMDQCYSKINSPGSTQPLPALDRKALWDSCVSSRSIASSQPAPSTHTNKLIRHIALYKRKAE